MLTRPRQAHQEFLVAAAPVLMAAVLCMPCLSLGYFWDDFIFLDRVRTNPISSLGPLHGAFYRPLSQALYYWPLAWLGSSGAPVAHAINLILAAICILLLVSLVTDLAGERAGAAAGLVFAGLAALPGLVAWASGSQDLLAILFVLAALHLRNSGRILPSLVATGAALLSKETAACALPVLLLWDWIVGRRPARIREGVPAYGALALGWVFLHPGIRKLASEGFARPPWGHVGFSNLAVSEFQARHYLSALFNAPSDPGPAQWPRGAAAMLVTALALIPAGVWITSRREVPREEAPRLSLPRAAILGFLLALPALALPSLLISRWVSYFVCMPALGTSIALGVALSRLPAVLAIGAIAVFVGLGFWTRYADRPPGDALTENRFVEASRATGEVERAFRRLHPLFPRGSQVLLSVASSGPLGIDFTMQDGQALRAWYRDPTILTLRPERRLPHRGPEYLFRITESRDVVEIDPDSGTFRSSGVRPDAEEMNAITRTYARGLTASGEPDRATRILSRLAAHDEPMLRSYDQRLSAMAALMKGDRTRAAGILADAPVIPREFALYAVSKILAEPTMRADLDGRAYEAFGLSSSDPEALRYLMRVFYGSLFVPQTVRLARRLQEVAPGDSESAAILGAWR